MVHYYHTDNIVLDDGSIKSVSKKFNVEVKPKRRTGVMIVGLGGNNGSTFLASSLAHHTQMSWPTKHGEQQADFYGSIAEFGTLPVGRDTEGHIKYVPFKSLMDSVSVDSIVISGWDISSMNMYEATKRAEVLPYTLQVQLQSKLSNVVPLKSIYYPDFIAKNQNDRADHVLTGSHACQAHLDTIRRDIRIFKTDNNLEHVVVLWSANTERFMKLSAIHQHAEALLTAIARDEPCEIAPSLMFAVAAIQEHCTFLNGSPQNTIVPAVVELARMYQTNVGGSDFKSGQTKFKSAMVDYMISSGLKVKSIVSYNHLGNNDGKNLSSYEQFRSKEISKSNLVTDMVKSNQLLFKDGEVPDHKIVIEYVPSAKDDKKAIDEYISSIFMGGQQVMSTYNICPDSLLAVPIMFDLIIFSEWLDRIEFTSEVGKVTKLGPVLSPLSFFFKSPETNPCKTVSNSFFLQRNNLIQLILATNGLSTFNPLDL
jgi:myo-inositol-1-phosphate synthase